MLLNDRLLKALRREPVDRTPIWLMRQAGRYLPEYRKLREQAKDFVTFCQTPELACEATLQPLQRFPLDAAIIFSDILTIPMAMGMPLQFVPEVGPVFADPLQHEKQITALMIPDVAKELAYVSDAIRLTKRALDNAVPLIGFSGSPWTLACYMIDGRNRHEFIQARRMIYQRPDLLKILLQKLTQTISQYLLAQIAAGADVIMLFDSWGGLLTADTFLEFSLTYLQEIITTIKKQYPQLPIILFSRGAGQWLSEQAKTGCDALGIDWQTSLQHAGQQVGAQVALQGNLDPAALLGEPTILTAQVKKILQVYGGAPGHVFNLGHGINQHTPLANVQLLVETVHDYVAGK